MQLARVLIVTSAVMSAPVLWAQDARRSIESMPIDGVSVLKTLPIVMPVATRAPAVLLIGPDAVTAPMAEALAAAGVAAAHADLGAISSAADVERAVRDAATIISLLRNDARFPLLTVAGHGDRALVAALAARAARADGFVAVAAPKDLTDGAGTTLADERARMTIPTLDVDGAADPAPANIARFARRVPALGRSGTSSQRPESTRRSLRSTAIATVNGVRIAIEYGRPSKRSREIWGALVPWDREWMPGADEATTLTTNKPIHLGPLAVPAGDHTLYAWPKADEFLLIVNKQTGQFHTVYSQGQDLGRVPMTLTMRTDVVEQLTYAIDPAGAIVLSWDNRDYRVGIRTP